VVIGAGVGGLVAALELARRDCEVIVVEQAAAPGGKMREIEIAGQRIDAGPTVLTMRWVFEAIFSDAGASLADHLALRPAEVLARHAWSEDERLDLFSDVARSAEEVGRLAGAGEARRFLEFCQRAGATYETLEKPFILSSQPSPTSLTLGAGLRGLGDLWRISPFTTLWSALGTHFHDVRLRQLFGRYATYCGSSPFEAPATLMLVAHVEREGVWLVQGGMHKLASALADLAIKHGAVVRYATAATEIVVDGGRAARVRLASGEELACDAVVANGDPAALSRGYLGRDAARAVGTRQSTRSLSAVTWALLARAGEFPFLRHNVFFSGDYKAEFDDIFRANRLPSSPTVYVCAQDRGAESLDAEPGAERFLVLVNAPPTGDSHTFGHAEIEQCRERAFALLTRCGAKIHAHQEATVATTPNDFDRLFPGSGGALYGPASHGWTASFTRPTARTQIPGLYLAGGCTHPGPGVPMAAISGRLAAAQVCAGLASTSSSRTTAMFGGTSMRSATTAITR
jgi:1-hydroxycarotenoid 3,4-desaturase